MAEADNKMWEGHRIIYPNLRDKYLESKREVPSRPHRDQQSLDELENTLQEALQTKEWSKFIIWYPEGSREMILQPYKIEKWGASFVLYGKDRKGKILKIALEDILDIQV